MQKPSFFNLVKFKNDIAGHGLNVGPLPVNAFGGMMAASPAEFAAVALELEATAPGRAEELYRQAIALDDTYSCAYVNLSCLLIEQGKLDEAIAVCRDGLRQCPEAALLRFNMGVIYDEAAESELALNCYLAAIAIEPGLADAHYNLHLLYENRGDQTAALRHLAAYVRLTGAI